MIREDNVTLETLQEDLASEGIKLKEYVTRSEGSALLTVSLNKVLIDKYNSFPSVHGRIMKTVTLGDGQGSDIKFPDLNGINPAYVPELSEIPFANQDITSTTVEPDKFAIRAGISQEMIDDNEVNLLGWTMGTIGTKMAETEDEEAIKALHTYCGAAAAVDTSLVTYKGRYNRGVYHLTGTCTNTFSATALDWEDIVNTGMNVMQSQTISLLGDTYRYPVMIDTLFIHTSKAIGAKKVLASSQIIVLSGIGAPGGGGTMVGGGKNFYNGILNVVESPFCPTRTAYALDSKRGSVVFVQRKKPALDKNANWAFDAQEVRARSRFRAAVIEERGIMPILF